MGQFGGEETLERCGGGERGWENCEEIREALAGRMGAGAEVGDGGGRVEVSF